MRILFQFLISLLIGLHILRAVLFVVISFLMVYHFEYFFPPKFRIFSNGRTSNALKMLGRLSLCITDHIYIEAEDVHYKYICGKGTDVL